MAGLADPLQRLAGRVGADLTETAQTIDFARLQDREHLVAPIPDMSGGGESIVSFLDPA